MSLSYRFAFFLQVSGMVFQVFVLYFVSELIGSHPSLEHYGGFLPFATIGMSVLNFFQTSFRSFAQAIRNEQMTGTIESMLMTPTSIPTLVIGSSLWSLFWSVLQATLYVGCASILFDFEIKGSLFWAAVLLSLLTLFVGSLGVISASFTIVFKRGDPLGFFVGTLSALIGGAVIPVSILPSWLQMISYLHPFTYGLNALRAILLMGDPVSSITTDILILLGSVCVIVPLSLLCFSKSIAFARREGSLIQY